MEIINHVLDDSNESVLRHQTNHFYSNQWLDDSRVGILYVEWHVWFDNSIQHVLHLKYSFHLSRPWCYFRHSSWWYKLQSWVNWANLLNYCHEQDRMRLQSMRLRWSGCPRINELDVQLLVSRDLPSQQLLYGHSPLSEKRGIHHFAFWQFWHLLE